MLGFLESCWICDALNKDRRGHCNEYVDLFFEVLGHERQCHEHLSRALRVTYVGDGRQTSLFSDEINEGRNINCSHL